MAQHSLGVQERGKSPLALTQHLAMQMAKGRGLPPPGLSPVAHYSLPKVAAPCLQTGSFLKLGKVCEHPCVWSWPSF